VLSLELSANAEPGAVWVICFHGDFSEECQKGFGPLVVGFRKAGEKGRGESFKAVVSKSNFGLSQLCISFACIRVHWRSNLAQGAPPR
jgi:hypothetical protein